MSRIQASTLACLIIFGTLIIACPPCAAQGRGVADVTLHQGGVLRGHVLNDRGVLQPDRDVLIRQDGQTIGTAKSNEMGEFCISNLRGGVYMVSSGTSARVIRAWVWRTAPPAAGNDLKILVPSDESLVVRGQVISPWQRAYDFVEAYPLVGYGMIVTAIAVPIAVIGHNQENKGPAS